MKLTDISLRKRLFLANALMVVIPVCLLLLLGAGALLALQLSGTQKQDVLAALWPDQGASVTVQYATSSLRVRAERPGKIVKVKDFQEDFSLLESQGIHCLLMQDDKVLYVTSGVEPQEILQQFSPYAPKVPVMLWLGNRFLFRYFAMPNHLMVVATGDVPFLAQNWRPHHKHVHWDSLWYGAVIAGIILIVLLGLYLSRLLSKQILQPLGELRQTAQEIRAGNLEHPVTIQAKDELGQVCQDFESMRKSLLAARQRQQAYDESRKKLIAGISHDLSTPLTTIRGYADGLRDGIARTPEKQQHYLEQISSSAAMMDHLVGDLFLLSKLDLGHIEFQMEKIPLVAYFADFTQEQQGFLLEKGIDWQFVNTLAKEDKALVQLDRQKFQRILQNLLSNSKKYAGKTPVQVTATLSRYRHKIRLSVADNGQGVAKEDLPHLFDDFYRTDPARSHPESGSGLGLAIVRQLVLGMQGRVWAEETTGGGLTIVMDFPAVTEEKKEA